MSEPTKPSRKLPIFLIVGPTLAILSAIILYAVVNFLIGSFAPEASSDSASVTQGTDLFGDNGVFKTIMNVLLFLVGALGVFALIPCFIIGVVLLVTRHSDNGARVTHEDNKRTWDDIE